MDVPLDHGNDATLERVGTELAAHLDRHMRARVDRPWDEADMPLPAAYERIRVFERQLADERPDLRNRHPDAGVEVGADRLPHRSRTCGCGAAAGGFAV